MKIAVGSLIVLAGVAGLANAQSTPPFETGTRLSFQVFNGTSWTNSIDVLPGSNVQFRVTVSYIGTNTNVFALGNMRMQPTFGGVDNTNDLNGLDNLAPWRNNGDSGNTQPAPNGMMTQAEASLPVVADMGRVFPFGSTGMSGTSATGTRGTTFRHDGGANRAPAGSWMRLSGFSSSNWPLPTMTAAQATAAEINNILRGVAISQLSQANANGAHLAGTADVVVFRGSITLSAATDVRTVTISNAQGSLLRHGSVGSAVDDRYVSWQTSSTDLGSWRTGVLVENGLINVVPTPASLALLGLGGLVAARRRRA